MSGIAFFLQYCLQSPIEDPLGRGWDWNVLDREGTHQDMLQMLIRESPEFAKTLLGTDGKVLKCIRQPEKGTFDLGVTLDNGEERQIELKVDQLWGLDQVNKQVNYLRNRPYTKGLILTLSQSAFRISKSAVQQKGQGYFEKLSYQQLYHALEAGLSADTDPGLHECMKEYRTALQEQERAKEQVFGQLGDPNG